jgi:hypothetical protein
VVSVLALGLVDGFYGRDGFWCNPRCSMLDARLLRRFIGAISPFKTELSFFEFEPREHGCNLRAVWEALADTCICKAWYLSCPKESAPLHMQMLILGCFSLFRSYHGIEHNVYCVGSFEHPPGASLHTSERA